MRRAVFYSPATIVGGAERYLSWLLPPMTRTWEVTLCCPDTRELDIWVKELRAHGVRVFRFDPARRLRRLVDCWRLARLCMAADLLHLNLIKPSVAPLIGVLGLLTGVPMRIGTQHLVLTPEEMSRYRLKQVLLRAAARLHRFTLRRVVCPSESSAEILVSRFGFPPGRLRMVHYGVDLDRAGMNRDPRPRPDPGGGSWPVLGCVGRVQERKGQYLIVEALPALCELFPRVLALLAGGGPDIEPLRERARALGVERQVCFAGHRDDVDALFRQMDVFLLPSRAEGLSIAMIEAMGHRLPVIASDIAPSREVLGSAGIFLRSRTPDAIVEAVTRLFAMDDPRALGAAARARAEREFPLQRMVDATLCLFTA